MITVSDAWKVAQTQRLVPISEVSITYEVTEPFLHDDATCTSEYAHRFSQEHRLIEKQKTGKIKYFTGEWNTVRLDGSCRVRPDSYQEPGFVSRSFCAQNGVFSEIPVITVSLSQIHEALIPGVMITWSETYQEYATKFRVRVWNGEEIRNEHNVENNTDVVYVWQENISDYDRVTVEIFAWSRPYHRARLEEVFLGVYQVYGKSDLMGYVHEQSADLVSAELSKNVIEFRLDNSTQRWNMGNPEGLEKYLLERQSLVVRYGLELNGDIEWIKAGTFYLSEWDSPSNGLEATFAARDLLEFCLDDYTGVTSGTLKQIAEAALSQALIRETQYSLDSRLDAITTDFTEVLQSGPMQICEVLQMVANAASCCLWQDRDGILRIEPLNETLTDYVIGRLTGGSAGVAAMMTDDLLDDMGGVVDYSAVSTAYTHPEIVLSKPLKGVNVNSGLGAATNSSDGTTENLDNPLIVDASTANAVAEWCKDVLKNRKTVSGEFRADPRLDVLDRITVMSRYGSNDVYVTNIRYDYTGSFRGTYTGRVMDGGDGV